MLGQVEKCGNQTVSMHSVKDHGFNPLCCTTSTLCNYLTNCNDGLRFDILGGIIQASLTQMENLSIIYILFLQIKV